MKTIVRHLRQNFTFWFKFDKDILVITITFILFMIFITNYFW